MAGEESRRGQALPVVLQATGAHSNRDAALWAQETNYCNLLGCRDFGLVFWLAEGIGAAAAEPECHRRCLNRTAGVVEPGIAFPTLATKNEDLSRSLSPPRPRGQEAGSRSSPLPCRGDRHERRGHSLACTPSPVRAWRSPAHGP
jgi:hypothetical protein